MAPSAASPSAESEPSQDPIQAVGSTIAAELETPAELPTRLTNAARLLVRQLYNRHSAVLSQQQREVIEEPQSQSSSKPRYNSRTTDWLPVARALATFPKSAPIGIQDTIEVDREGLLAYTGSHGPNSWNEKGVHVKLPEYSDFLEGDTRPVILRGLPQDKATVRHKLTNLAGHGNVTERLGVSADDSLDAVQSIASFAHFVYNITDRYAHRAVEKDAYGDYHQYAADILAYLFTDPVKSRYASTVALNRALLFLSHHIDLYHTASLVYAQGRRMSLGRNIATLNLRLAFAVRHNHYEIGNAAAREILDHEIQPDHHTWSILYEAVAASPPRQEIIHMVQEANVAMTDRAWSRFASATLDKYLKTTRDDAPEKLATVIVNLDTTFGPEWISLSTLHRALATCQQKRLYAMAQLLSEVADARGIAIGQHTHVYIFALLRSRQDNHSGIKLLAKMVDNNEEIDLKWVIPYMFMAAWERHRLSTCHVLWVFAATHGLITRTMRTVMHKALLYNHRNEVQFDDMSRSQVRRALWRRTAARVICGIDEQFIDSGIGFEDILPRLREHFAGTDPLRRVTCAEMVMDWAPVGPIRDEQVSLIFVLMGHDMSAWKTFTPMSMETFREQLLLAHDRDLRWSSAKSLDKLIAMNTLELRKSSWRDMEPCGLKRAAGEFSEEIARKRDVVLQNLAIAGLSPRQFLERADTQGWKWL
jgi:hypothetical protein